jgi:hypothetical protein
MWTGFVKAHGQPSVGFFGVAGAFIGIHRDGMIQASKPEAIMNKLVLDSELRAKLGGATAGVEITDESGNPVGHFMTHSAFLKLAELLLPPPTREEIQEARAEMLMHGGVSTAEILEGIAEAKRKWEATR